MSNTVKLNTCPKCGAPIPAEAPQGLCPKCVLLGAATATDVGVPATATSEIPSIERIATAFPQLEILELIGRGGMGFVFKARQPHLDRFVALKLLPDKLAKDALFAERFNREGRVLARLNHPNIVSVFDFGQTGGFYYLLMEYVDGVNLRQAMRAGRFSPGEALSIVPKVCEALQYAHEQGILHRDIKPENILLDAKGRVKIADFGIAKLVGEDQPNVTLTNTGAALGTLHYMAPEQLEKPSTVDHRADIYSLGVVFYEMLTGELPIGRFAPPSSKTPVGAAVDEVVFRTLEKEPGKRFQSAGEVQTRVQDLADEASASADCSQTGRGGAELGRRGTAALGDGTPVERPAKALLATGILNWIGSIAVVCLLAFTELGQKWPLAPAELGVIAVLIFVLSSIVMAAGWKMRRLESYPLAVLGSVLAMITSPGSILGLPVGIWALLTLRLPKVRAAFKGEATRAARFPVSRWAIYGALGVGLSLPVPLLMIVSILTGRSGLGVGELWLVLGSVALPGLGGTLLGWLGLNEIRDSGGRVRGLPLAMFATLTWPLFVLAGLMVGLPMFILGPNGGAGASHTLGRILMLVLPAGVVTFAFGAIHATGRWASRRPAPQERGVLKWIFIGVLVVGMGAVLVTRRHYESRAALASAEKAAAAAKAPIEAAPMIQFTFTSVELREETGSRWLAMDFVQQVRGDCEHTFRYDARVPGFTAQTRKDSRLSDAQAGFVPVMHQRILWKLPDSLPQDDALALRDLVAKEWVGKSAAIEPDDERVLFKTLIPDGGTLAAAVGVKLKDTGSRTLLKTAIGSAKLIAAGEYGNFAIARLMSGAGHPLHQIIARFAGPEIPQTSRAALSGPLLVPSPDEDVKTPAEPVDGSILWGTNRAPVASAVSFECPGDHSLQFVLPDENLARDAARQMNQLLAQPISLVPGRQVPLFTSGNWKGWLETRPFKPEPDRLTFFRHPGRSPAQIPGTNSIESAVATIPLGHELKVTGRLAVNGVSQSEPAFSTTLTSGPNEPGIYWFTWYLLPNPQRMDMKPKENWVLQIHDAIGRELLRSQAPERMNVLWRKKWVGDEPISVRAGKQIREIFFEKAPMAGDRSVTFLLLEMTMQPTVAAAPIPPTGFGPDTEVTLTGLFSGGGQLALDREKQVSLPPEGKDWDRTKLLRWLADEGVDLAVIDYDDEKYGWGLAMRPTTSHLDSPWQVISVEDLKHSLANPVMHLEKMDAADNRMNLYRLYPRAVPLSFAVRTVGGRMAALQIIGFSENPRGVKIRYKLTQNATPPPRLPVSSALEFRLVATDGDTTTPANELPERRRDGRETQLRVLRTVMLDGSAVARAGFETEPTGTVAIGVELTPEGARQFGAITAANTGRRLAIVSHGQVLSAPFIRGPITGGELKISGSFSADEVRRLVATLNRQPAGLEFAPVVERTLPGEGQTPAGTLCLDLDSGRFLTNQVLRPNQEEEWNQTWDRIRASGADILGFDPSARAAALHSLNSFHLTAIDAPESAWDNLAAEEVGWNWALMQDASKQDTQLAAPTNAPGTFLFRTRENGFGLLQILPATNAAPDVKIRYKLVRGATSRP